MKEPIFKNCCCCCDLKIGCCIYVGLSLLGSVLELFQSIGNLGSSRRSSYDDYGYGYSRSQRSNDMPEWTKFVNILLCSVTIITCILFFKGVSSKQPRFLLPFIITQTVTLVIITIVILFLLPLIGEAAILVLFIAAIPIGISAYLVTCVYSLYVSMEYGPGISAGHVFAPQVIVQSQMPQNFQPQNFQPQNFQPQNFQPQNVYYTANSTAPSYPQNSTLYSPNAYPSGPYNPNFYSPTISGQNSLPPNYNVAVNSPTFSGDEKPPIKY